MPVLGPNHGPDDDQFVHGPGQIGQQFRDLDPGNIGVDGLKRASYFRGSLGFDVVEILVSRTTGQVDHDDRLLRATQ